MDDMDDEPKAGCPGILIISFKCESFHEQYSELLGKLQTQANVKEVLEPTAASSEIDRGHYQAILVTDAAITERKHSNILSRLRKYLRAQLERLGHDQSRSKLNPGVSELATEGLAEMYPYTKAVYLRGMERDQMVYLNYTAPEDIDEGDDRDLDEYGQVVGEEQDTSVAFAGVDEGWVGFIGDLNHGVEMEKTVLSMCGLDAR
ncbi:Uu.00g084690.m01.CDS01 [Anthostomella pinea]|uniref:Uu.00g084690.m01.CDS01 n=1 Tax=Anthostomella pinea TaxID=933095 RepID=A0AAI8VGE8_9PEZI|nr:Uu.00g084690.m01.CDS01 [Anthostomella pinea]